MIEINLLPVEFRKKEIKKIKLPPLPTTKYFFGFLVLLVLIELIVLVFIVYMSSQHKNYKQQHSVMEPGLQEIQSIRDDTSDIQNRLRTLRSMTKRPFYWTVLLNTISDEITEGLWLTSIKVEEKVAVKKEAKRRGRKRAKKKGEKEEEQQKIKTLEINGLADSMRGGTAGVAKFIQRLEKEEDFMDPFEYVVLEKIGRTRQGSDQLFDFTVVCMFKEKAAYPHKEDD